MIPGPARDHGFAREPAQGIQFCSRLLGKPDEFRVIGFQADIGGGDLGTFYEEKGKC